MASTREERMQQRLRGAQRRQVKDVDFGLTFPVVPSSLDSAQHDIPSQSTPQQVLPRELPTSAHPAGSGRGRRHGAITKESNPPTTRSTTNDANISAKRRKLNNDLAVPSSTRNTRSSPHAPRPDTSVLLPEGDDREQPAADARNGSVEEEVEPDELEIVSHIPRQGIGPIASFSAPTTEVVTESPENAPGSGHRLRVSLDEATLQSLQLQARLQDSSIDSSPAERRKRKLGEATTRHLISSAKRSSRHQTSHDDDGELDELSPNQSRGRGRKPKQMVGEEPVDVEVGEEVAQVSPEEAEDISDDEAAAILKKSRGRGRSKNRAAKSPDLDEPNSLSSEVAKKKRGKARKIARPAQQRQSKVTTQTDQKTVSKTSKKATKSSKVRAGSPIPITVHRFTKRPLRDDEDSDADILNSEIPFIKRGGVNAIDVLRQVCHEIIVSGLDTLADGGRSCNDPALKREYKTKWSAVEAFGRELQNRLSDHTINLDNSFALEKRVREEQRRRLALREDILRVRADREQVGLRMDEVRIKHETESKDAQERDSLNNTIHDIELALERGKEQHPHDSVDDAGQMTGIELVLKRVAEDVSNKSDSGGILKQVKEFNAFLERAALALETRTR